MGRFYDDAPEHEGWVERELSSSPLPVASLGRYDERTGSWWCASWTSGLPAPTGRWRPACECGWSGPIADADEIAGIDADHQRDDDMLDEVVEDLLLASWERHVTAAATLDRLSGAARAAAAAERSLDDAVAAARLAGHSWEQVGRAVGVTRQAAHARWAGR